MIMLDSSSLFLLFLLSVSSFLNNTSVQNITIRTMKINGGRDGQKRALISEVAAQKKMDVLFLQETWKMATVPAVI